MAHRRGIHGEILSWDADDAVRIELVNVDLYDAQADVPREVTNMLRSVEQRLAAAVAAGGRRLTVLPQDDGSDAWPPDRIGASFASLHNHADHLDREARRLVANAHRMAGYETLAPSRVAEDVLSLTAAINDAAQPGSSDGA